MQSEWVCTVAPDKSLRMGLRYIRGLREAAGAIEAARRQSPFTSIDDLVHRVHELRKDELRVLAKTGALNFINDIHRRDAMWESERARRVAGPLLDAAQDRGIVTAPADGSKGTATCRLLWYRPDSRTASNGHDRPEMEKRGVHTAMDLHALRDGQLVKVAGAVIVRQRPGTAHGAPCFSVWKMKRGSRILLSNLRCSIGTKRPWYAVHFS